MKIYPFLILCCCMVCACNKYLDVKPKGYTLLSTVNDYDQWLGNSFLQVDPSVTALNYLGDNVDNPLYAPGSSKPIDLIYSWSPQFALSLDITPPIWSNQYAAIYYFNAVINGIGNAAGGTTQQKNALLGEALLGRAFEYLYLANEYGRVYDSVTANSDLAVPFVTSNDVSGEVPGRETVKAIYDQIISDLNTAIPFLPASNAQNRYRGSVAAGYSILARAYLYAGNYTDAVKNALLAISSDPSLSMNNYESMATLPVVMTSKEVIYARDAFGDVDPNTLNPFPNTYMTPTFMQLFDTTDLRLKKKYAKSDITTGIATPLTSFSGLGQRGTIVYLTDYYNTCAGPTLPEMKLIVAEGAARNNDLTTALQQLNDIRKKRFPAAAFKPLQSASRDTVLSWVLRERELEMPLNGTRWMDMRRLAAEGRMLPVYRLDGAGNHVAALPPDSKAYTLQIPDDVLRFNPGMPQNPL